VFRGGGPVLRSAAFRPNAQRLPARFFCRAATLRSANNGLLPTPACERSNKEPVRQERTAGVASRQGMSRASSRKFRDTSADGNAMQ